MPSKKLDARQVFALTDEIDVAIKLSQRGLAALWELDGANDFFHLPMQLLSQGFERLLKLTYAMAKLEMDEALPVRNVFRPPKGFGHDLMRLVNDLLLIVERHESYVSRPAVQQDLEFIRTNEDLRRILNVLSA